MSKSSVNCTSSVGTEVKFAGNDSKNKMYEPKHKKKLVRVLTVIAYIFSVSLAAITLSLFYLFIYNPGKSETNVGTSNSSGRYYIRNNEGFLIINNTYATYEREEPRALPLETIEKQKEKSKAKDTSDKKVKNISSEEMGKKEKTSFLTRIARTLSIT